MPNGAKRWCFTYQLPNEEKRLYIFSCFGLGPSDGPQGEWARHEDVFEYIRFQEEEAPSTGMHHLQGWMRLKVRKTKDWLKNHFLNGAHYTIINGTDQENEDYCTKKESKVEGGLEFRWGERPIEEEHDDSPKPSELRKLGVQWLDKIKREGYIAPKDIPSCLLQAPGFLSAYKTLTASCTGPNRSDLKILTLIGPPGSGKSHAVAKYFPRAGRWLDGNAGNWFLNPMADTMVFEEFDGSKIGIQAMKKFLDPYPYAFEVKGYTYPVMATRVIITSNIPPCLWYKDLTSVKDAGNAADKRALNINAIYDRIGYSGGGYIPSRTCGTYVEAPLGVAPRQLWDFFDKAVSDWLGVEHEELDDLVQQDDDEDDVDPSELQKCPSMDLSDWAQDNVPNSPAAACCSVCGGAHTTLEHEIYISCSHPPSTH